MKTENNPPDHVPQFKLKGSQRHKFNLVDEVGGIDRFRLMITDFYNRVYDDMIIGFMFEPFDKAHLIESQMAWASSKLGDRSGVYTGPSVIEAHKNLPIHPGMFDRRHKILEEVLYDWEVPECVRRAWLELDTALRENVVRWGKNVRSRMNGIEDSGDW